MRPGARTLCLFVAIVVAAGCLSPPPGDDGATVVEDDRRVVWFDTVRSPAEAVEVIERVTQFDGVEADVIGQSVEGRPIHLVSLGTGEFDFWVTGRVHGNEPSGMEAILLFLELLADPNTRVPDEAPRILHDVVEHREMLLERLTFWFVPVVNTDGAEAYTRGNSRGVDLNRDFFVFDQEESQVVAEAFWTVNPDGCLDLHNIGDRGPNDFEAYGPEGPMLEPELDALMRADSWHAVHELDAQGGRASGFNEDYRAPDPLHDHPSPTAYHPGTHDFFCTTRGAPGWTPEGAIGADGNGDDHPTLAWASRSHAVTVAASAFSWAGVYDGVQRHIEKPETSGAGAGQVTQYTFDVTPEMAGARGTFQVVWRQLAGYWDHNQVPTVFAVTAPDGSVYEGREPGLYQWSSTVVVDNVQEGTYTLDVVTPGATHETRVYLEPSAAPLAAVARVADGLKVTAAPDAPGTVNVTLTDVVDPGTWADATIDPVPEEVLEVVGTVHNRSVARWTLSLQPGEEAMVTVQGLGDDQPGPWRFTAISGDRVHMGHDTEPRVAAR